MKKELTVKAVVTSMNEVETLAQDLEPLAQKYEVDLDLTIEGDLADKVARDYVNQRDNVQTDDFDMTK